MLRHRGYLRTIRLNPSAEQRLVYPFTVDAITTAIHLDDSRVDLRYLRGLESLRRGSPTAALHDFETAFERERQQGGEYFREELLMMRALALEALGRFEEASHVLEPLDGDMQTWVTKLESVSEMRTRLSVRGASNE